MTQTNSAAWRRFPVLPVAVAGATLAVWLFYEQTLGWATGAFLVSIVVACAARVQWSRDRAMRRVLLVASLGLGAALIEQPTVLVIACAIAALGLLAMTCRAGWSERWSDWVGRWAWLFADAIARPAQDLRSSMRWFQRHPRSAGAFLRRSMLWSIPLGLGAGFIFLFSLANPIVETWVEQAWNQIARFIDSLDEWLEPGCVLLWCCFAGAIYALLRFRRRRRTARPPMAPSDTRALLAGALNSAPAGSIVVRCLLVFNVIFAVQTVLDGIYLVGERALPPGMTYVQYAHRGAYPLIATALLAGLFVLITFRDDSRTNTRRDARWLVYLWIGQNVGLTVSAAWRLKMLVDHSDLTRLRLSTTIWLGLVSLGLLSLIWRIARSRSSAWLIRVDTTLALATLYACCFVNLDGFIARYNADRGDESGPGGRGVSLDYMQHLGPSALPAVRALEQTLPTVQRRNEARRVDATLVDELREHLRNWRGWTWRRERLLAWSEANPPAPKAVEAPPSAVPPARDVDLDRPPRNASRRLLHDQHDASARVASVDCDEQGAAHPQCVLACDISKGMNNVRAFLSDDLVAGCKADGPACSPCVLQPSLDHWCRIARRRRPRRRARRRFRQ